MAIGCQEFPALCWQKIVLLEMASGTVWIFNLVNDGIPRVSHPLLAAHRCVSWWHTSLEKDSWIVTLAMLNVVGGPSAFVVGRG